MTCSACDTPMTEEQKRCSLCCCPVCADCAAEDWSSLCSRCADDAMRTFTAMLYRYIKERQIRNSDGSRKQPDDPKVTVKLGALPKRGEDPERLQ